MDEVFRGRDAIAFEKMKLQNKNRANGYLSQETPVEANSLITDDLDANVSLLLDDKATVKQPLLSPNGSIDAHINVSARVSRVLYAKWRDEMGKISLSSYLTLKMKEDLK